MGELLLCNEAIAAMPYFIEDVSLNLYSLEELSYYIMNNVYLIDRDFMNEELCTWISSEVKLPKLAAKLREIMHGNGPVSDFCLEILKESGYCTMQEIQQIIFAIRQMEQKTDFECSKIRADKLMENQKFLGAIYEYKRLLESEDAKKENAEIGRAHV